MNDSAGKGEMEKEEGDESVLGERRKQVVIDLFSSVVTGEPRVFLIHAHWPREKRRAIGRTRTTSAEHGAGAVAEEARSIRCGAVLIVHRRECPSVDGSIRDHS